MITYTQARDDLQSGDIFMVKGTHLIGRLIRMVTGESVNHIALVIRNNAGVWVIEMLEGVGWRKTPASKWLFMQKKKEVFWGKFPGEKRGDPCHEEFAMSKEGAKYSYWTLITVWLSQWGHKDMPVANVCSTFCEEDWEKAGVTMRGVADPGEFFSYARDINAIF